MSEIISAVNYFVKINATGKLTAKTVVDALPIGRDYVPLPKNNKQARFRIFTLTAQDCSLSFIRLQERPFTRLYSLREATLLNLIIG